MAPRVPTQTAPAPTASGPAGSPPVGASSSRRPVIRWRSGSTRSRAPCSSSTHTASSPTATAAAGPGNATRPVTASPEATGVASVRTVFVVGRDPAASPSARLPACRRPTTPKATSITTTPAATSHRSRLAAFTPTPGHRLRPVRQIVHLAPPSRPTHPVRAAVATRRDADCHGRHPRGAANAALGRLYELGLLLRTASGRVHPLTAYLGWLYDDDVGFEPLERHRLVGRVQTVLLVARKPPTDNVRSHSRRAPPSRSATEHIPSPPKVRRELRRHWLAQRLATDTW